MHIISNLILLFLLFLSTNVEKIYAEELSPVTEKTYPKVQKIDQEIGSFGRQASELILHTSYLQDILLTYLHDAENQEAYTHGMQLFQENFSNLKSVSTYITSIFNFYTGEYEIADPQMASTQFCGQQSKGFLNTFKTNKELTAEERALFFDQEAAHYARDAIEYPFILDHISLSQLEAETTYNFVLLPDATIRIAKERPGDREYHVRDEMLFEAFRYPNHTILANDPDQIVITAGALIFYQIDDKKLFFISCKSGHFQPTYNSLTYMKEQLAHVGVNPCTIIMLPDLDMSASVIKTYKGAQVPLLLTQNDAQALFKIANDRWNKWYHEIDKTILEELALGNMSILNDGLKAILKKQRAEATYMRSAYHLFTQDHLVPTHFSELVKRFGKFKDAIKKINTNKFNPERVQEEAARLLTLIQAYDEEYPAYQFFAADDQSLHSVICANNNEIHDLLTRESLTKDEYHKLKKLSRETGVLFLYMASNVEYKTKGFLIFRTAADGFFQINDLMASTDYVFAQSLPEEEIRLKVPRKIANLLNKYLARLGIAPVKITFPLDPKDAFWTVNYAKELYMVSHHVQEIFYSIANHETADTTNLLEPLQLMLRYTERAENILIFLDKTHTVSDAYQIFKDAIVRMIRNVQNDDFASINKEADDFWRLCYSVPASGFNMWECTDQASFDAIMQKTLRGLQDPNVDVIRQKIQAFRDFINLTRKNGMSKSPDALPMVCFDALEEHADIILEELQHGYISDKMQQSISFILTRCLD